MAEAINHTVRVIALCGKGGVGKTSLSAAIVKILMADPRHKVLAIDADPAFGLASALGMKAVRTVDDIRRDIVRLAGEGKTGDRAETVARLDYEVFSALEEKDNLAFLAVGRPEAEGCYCQVNHFLRDIIASTAGNFDYVVIDGEAGLEQINRRVMEKVSHLILVADSSAKALKVAADIKQVSESFMAYEESGLIVNRLRGLEEWEKLRLPPGLNRLGWVPEDEDLRACDIEGGCVLDLNNNAAIRAVEKCLTVLGLA